MSTSAREWEAPGETEAVGGLTLPLWPVLGLALMTGALLLRVGALDALPLSPDEAARALQARAIFRGWTADYGDSPLLINLTALSMTLFTTADGPARLPSALAGWGLCLAPLLFRDRLGWLAAASACVLLTISPLGVLASRSVDPAALVLLATACGAGCLLRAFDQRDGRWLLGTGLAAAVGLGAGPAFVGQLAAVALAASIWPPFGGRTEFNYRLWVARAIGVLLATALVLDTLLLTRPAGLQAGLASPLSGWLVWLGLSRATLLSGLALGLHEALLIGLAGWGAIGAVRTDTGRFLLIWALASGVLGVLRQQPALADLSGPMVPLALLAGVGVTRLGWLARARRQAVWLTALALLAPLAFFLLSTNNALNRGANPALPVLAIAAGALVAIGLFASTWLDRPELAVTCGLVVLVGLVAAEVTFLTRLNFAGAERDGPALFKQVSRPELRQVEARVRDWWRQEPETPVVVDTGLRPALEWSLRDGPPVQWSSGMPANAARSIVGADTTGARPVGTWIRLVVGSRYLPPEEWPSAQALWRWVVLRQPIARMEPYAILVPQT